MNMSVKSNLKELVDVSKCSVGSQQQEVYQMSFAYFSIPQGTMIYHNAKIDEYGTYPMPSGTFICDVGDRHKLNRVKKSKRILYTFFKNNGLRVGCGERRVTKFDKPLYYSGLHFDVLAGSHMRGVCLYISDNYRLTYSIQESCIFVPDNIRDEGFYAELRKLLSTYYTEEFYRRDMQ